MVSCHDDLSLGNNLPRCLSAGAQPFCSLCVHVLHFVSVSLHVRVVHIQCCQDV